MSDANNGMKVMDEERMKEILEEIRNNPKYEEEAKFILFIYTYFRDGEFPASKEFDVLVGTPQVIRLHHEKLYDILTETFAILPLEVPTIILQKEFTDRGEEYDLSRTLFIFDGNSWVRLPIKNG